MSRARTLQLMALKKTIALQAYRQEATRLFDEIARLDGRLAQIAELDRGYRDQLAVPDLHVTEYRDVMQIIGRLRERSDIDQARNQILIAERTRLRTVLAEKKRQIDKLEESADQARKEERQERDERLARLTPARRS
jgi:regulator of replication initiation timing